MKIRPRLARTLRLLWPVGVLLMTPLVLLGGVAALIGVVALEAGRRLPAPPHPRRAQLAPVAHLESAPATDSMASAA